MRDKDAVQVELGYRLEGSLTVAQALREGSDGTLAWMRKSQDQFTMAQALHPSAALLGSSRPLQGSLTDLRERVGRGLSMLRQGWWEGGMTGQRCLALRVRNAGQEHFRLFHTHDRGSSPVVRINLPISITTHGTNWHSLEEMLLMRSLLPSLLRTMEDGYQVRAFVAHTSSPRTPPLLLLARSTACMWATTWVTRCLTGPGPRPRL